MEKNHIKVSHEHGVIVVELMDVEVPKFDEPANQEIAESLFAVAKENGSGQMVVSFAKVRYVGSSMLGTLIRLSKRIAECGGSLKLCDLPPTLREMFVITKLDTVFSIYEDRQAALDGF